MIIVKNLNKLLKFNESDLKVLFIDDFRSLNELLSYLDNELLHNCLNINKLLLDIDDIDDHVGADDDNDNVDNDNDNVMYSVNSPLNIHQYKFQLSSQQYLLNRYKKLFNVHFMKFNPVVNHYLSICPPLDAILLSLGESDHLIFQLETFSSNIDKLPTNIFKVYDNPLNENFKLVYFKLKDNGKARKIIRNTYCNGNWITFNSLINLINIGGSNGLDDKLFNFFYPTNQFTLNGDLKGYYRFEFGKPINEFSDLRANSRCLIESQFFTIKRFINHFEKYFNLSKSTPIYLTGSPTQSSSIVKILSDILNKIIYLPSTTINNGKSNHHSYLPLLGLALFDNFVNNDHNSNSDVTYEESVRYRRKCYNSYNNINDDDDHLDNVTSTSTTPSTPLTPQLNLNNNNGNNKILSPVNECFELPTISPSITNFDQKYTNNYQFNYNDINDCDKYLLPDHNLSLIYQSLIDEHDRLESISVKIYSKNQSMNNF